MSGILPAAATVLLAARVRASAATIGVALAVLGVGAVLADGHVAAAAGGCGDGHRGEESGGRQERGEIEASGHEKTPW